MAMYDIATALFFIGSVYREVKQSFIDMEALFQLQETPSSVVDKENALPFDAFTMGTAISLRNVHFAYPTSTAANATTSPPPTATTPETLHDEFSIQQQQARPILQGATLDIPQGKTVAIVGSSGCGKSTILRLLYRFFDPNSGEVLVGGHDIRDLKKDSLQRAIAVVPQDVVLFHESIGYNIQYGNIHATWDDVLKAAKQAKIHDTIMSFPDGYDTVVGERGLKLSGGEKQRVRYKNNDFTVSEMF